MKFFERFVSTRFTNLTSLMQQKLPQFIQLTRINRPIGIFLLFWPTITSLWIASEGMPEFLLLIVFSLGTILMRSAGCCINDFADYGIDGKVRRPQERPIVLKKLSRREDLG